MKDEKIDNGAIVDLDWENRVLCSDESCIGVIGPDGRCKECGRAYEGDLPAAAAPAAHEPDQKTEPDVPADAQPQPLETQTPASADDADWEKRTLCSDESCIGVIGADGCCKECGKPYAG